MKARFLWIMVIVLILLSLPALVLAQPPITPSSGPSGDGVEGAPLGSPDVLWDQPYGGGLSIASQYFTDFGYAFYSADDFMNAEPWNIESIFVDGFSAHLSQADNLHWLIYPDNGGVPAGYPDIGGELWSHTCKPSDPEVTISGSGDQVTLDIVTAQGAPLYLPPGTYWLCFYPSLNFGLYGQWYWDIAGTTNFATAQFIDPTNYFGMGWTSWTPWSTVVPGSYDAAFQLEGSTMPPVTSNLKYLHCTGGLFDLADPLDTQWHELWPVFCREYHLSSWEDNGDGILSYCDSIDMYEKPDGELRPYHVENVTITLFLTPERDSLPNDPRQPMYIELKGGFNETALMQPLGTLWHEIYPNFCTTYNLTGWEDNGNRTLDFCDYIELIDTETENVTSWHVEEVAVDIIVTPEPPPVGGEAYPVNKASLLAPWIAAGLVLAGGISWYFLRRRKAQS
ncbi:hypothetical protein ACFLVV_03695 [Chloroflexota bacterium]